jgi:hypothetical protein
LFAILYGVFVLEINALYLAAAIIFPCQYEIAICRNREIGQILAVQELANRKAYGRIELSLCEKSDMLTDLRGVLGSEEPEIKAGFVYRDALSAHIEAY